MSVKQCFKASKNKALKKIFNAKIKSGTSEDVAAVETVKEYASILGNKLSKVTGEQTDIEINLNRKTETVKVKKIVETEVPSELIGTKVSLKRADTGIKGKRNKVFNMFEEALLSPVLYESMMTSIDNDTTETMLGAMLPDVATGDAYVFTPKAAVETRFNLKAGMSGIGDMVNANNDHTRSQGREIKLDIELGDWGNSTFDEGFSEFLDTTENVNDEDANDILDDINIYRKSIRKSPLTMQEFNRRKITDSLSELTNAFVDIANKNAFITRGNWGALLNSYGTMLLRSGVHPIKVFSMIRNPGMTMLIKEISTREGIIQNENSENIRKKLINGLRERFNTEHFNEQDMLLRNLDDLNPSKLYFSAKSQDMYSAEELSQAIIILEHFNNQLKTIKKYANAVITAKVGENGIKKSVGDYVVLTNRLSNALQYTEQGTGFRNLERKYFDELGNETLLMTFHKNTVGLFESIIRKNPDLFMGINESNIQLINNIISDSSNSQFIQSPYNVNKIIEAMDTYYFSEFRDINKQYEAKYLKTLENKFFTTRKAKKYAILNKIYTEKDENDNLIFYSNRVNTLDNVVKNKLVASWRELLKNDKELGEFLINRAFRQSGFQGKVGSFHELIPTEWFIANGIEDHISDTSKFLPGSFFKQVAINDIGKDVYTSNSIFKPVPNSQFFTTENNLGRFANPKKGNKFALYSKDRNGEVYQYIGKEVFFGKKVKEKGIYIKLPELEANSSYYSSDIAVFNNKLGILSLNEYIKEYENIPYKGSIKRGFFKLDYDEYRKDHMNRLSIIEMHNEVVESYKGTNDMNELQDC